MSEQVNSVGEMVAARTFIDKNGGYQTIRTGVDKEAHDAWQQVTSWGLSRDDFIRLSYFNGDLDNGSDGSSPVNGYGNRPSDVVYRDGNSALTRDMVSEWLSHYTAFVDGYRIRAKQDAERIEELEQRLEAVRHCANEWADMALNGLQWTRNIAEGISSAEDARDNMEVCLEHCREVNNSVSALHQTSPAGEPAAVVVSHNGTKIGSIRSSIDLACGTILYLAGDAVSVNKVPDGWQLVPKEMTDEMDAAFCRQLRSSTIAGLTGEQPKGLAVKQAFRAALDVAPNPGEQS